MKIFAKIRFYWGAAVISLVSAGIMVPALFLFPKKKGEILHYFNRLNMFLMNAKVVSEGEMDTEAQMYLMNHQGIIDIVAFEALQTQHVRWVAKKELFETPWFGQLLKKGDMISLDRGSKTGIIKLLKDVKETVESQERAVAIFPEGTRAKGQKLLPFKQGANIIAKKLGLKVQPVVITGSKWVLNEHDKTGHSGTVHYKFLPTIDVANAPEDWYEKLQVQMQEEIDDAYTNHHRSR